ncbi:hypothetical protein JCM10207_004166 [Rhodosporidiobolus poonsookiae]
MTYSWALIESHISTLVEVLNEQGHVALAAETSRLLKKNLEEWYEMATDSEKGQLINVLFRVRKEIKERRWTPHTARDVWERVKLAVGAESPLSSTSSSPVSSRELTSLFASRSNV